jgi:PucR family transcriptional regulator, purine catabolism regulatory protein
MGNVTLAEILALPVVRRGDVQVRAGGGLLERGVRWLHASDLLDVAPLLRAGDLVLTTGIGFPPGDWPGAYTAYAQALAAAGAAGVIVELGRRWSDSVPSSLVDAFVAHDLPLVVLRHEVRFAAVTQAVGELIVDRQLAELRDAERVHETFTELSLADARPREILEAVQRLAGSAVVVESDHHQVLDYVHGAVDPSTFLEDWPLRSARVACPGRTSWDPHNGWLVARLGPADRSWGRLVIESPLEPPPHLIAIAGRAAAALTLDRRRPRERDPLIRRTHLELIRGLRADPQSPDVLRRCELARFPTGRRRFVGLVVRPRITDRTGRRPATDDVIATAVQACSEARVAALIGVVEGDAHILLSCAADSSEDPAVDQIGQRISRHHRVHMAAGGIAEGPAAIERTLREAAHILDAVPRSADGTQIHRLKDVHVRGLLSLLGGDRRMQLFVERELEPLLEHDRSSPANLIEAVRALLWHPSSKSDAAASLHLSRAAFYARLDKAEEVLCADLDDPDTRLSLHLALLATELDSFNDSRRRYERRSAHDQ